MIVLAAAAVPVAARDAFLRNVASRLSALPTDAEVRRAVAAALLEPQGGTSTTPSN
jgi:hypothetical protein